MGRQNNFSDDMYAEYATLLANKKAGDTVPKLAVQAFGVSLSYARQKAWEWMKHPTFIREQAKIEEMRESEDPVEKEEKLRMNRMLISEAYRGRDKETYIKLVRMDNEMQGHTRNSEQQDDKLEQGTKLISTFMHMLREKNKAVKTVEEEIIEIE